MAELADALDSGSSGRKAVEVQVFFRALRRNTRQGADRTNAVGSDFTHPLLAFYCLKPFNDTPRMRSMSTMELPAKSFVSVADAAEILGCTVGRIRQLLIDGTIYGMKLNARAWAVERKSVEKLARIPQKVGRPRLVQKVS